MKKKMGTEIKRFSIYKELHMKTPKKRLFYPIMALIAGLATITTYPGMGLSKDLSKEEDVLVDPQELLPAGPAASQIVPKNIISRLSFLSFSKDNKFAENERVVVKTKQGNYEYRTIKMVGYPKGAILMDLISDFEAGKPVEGAGYEPGFQLDYSVNGEVDSNGEPFTFTPSAKIGKILH